MTKKELKIVFMGTPEFAVESLRTLIENQYNVVGVVTMPDKPAGRGHKLQESAIKKYALEQKLPILQPEKLKDQTFLQTLQSWQADIQIVVAFRMLPEAVWAMPPLGTFNLHASLLPQYRGAAPINHAIINGEKETGVTTFFLTHRIDTGNIICQKKIPINPTDNAGTIHNKLMHLGATLVRETVDLVLSERVQTTSQESLIDNDLTLKTAPKIYKDTCRIDWNKKAIEIHNHIRGLAPYPTAWTSLSLSKDSEPIYLKVFESEIKDNTQSLPPGSIQTDGKTFLHVASCDNIIALKVVQTAGKKAMPIADLLRGMKLS